jgi:outer membrane protein assembly factor BamB
MHNRRLRRLIPVPVLLVTIGVGLSASDWPAWRGTNHDGISTETGLPERWSPSGENLAWTAPYGARSAPIVVGRRLYLQNTAGRNTNWAQADDIQERLLCIDTDTGKLLWQRTFSLGLSDVPPHRVGWASPAADPDTGNVYVNLVAGQLHAISPEGKPLWHRSLVEDFGMITTHGGRTTSVIVDGDLVILNGLISGWGPWARGGNRYFAFDKRTGETVWVASPQSRHYDTNYSAPIVTTVNGVRQLLVGGTDGSIHALKAATGEPLWKFEMTKRAINTSVAMDGTTAIVTHSEENIDTNEMGLIAALDLAKAGAGGPPLKWKTLGWMAGFSSPIFDGTRIYQIDNGAVLAAFDRATGEELWTHGLGTLQKASPVLADGKLYVGTENGRFFILRPGATGVETLDEDLLGTPEAPEPVLASAAVANGRVYVASMSTLYAIGKGTSAGSTRPAASQAPPAAKPGPPAFLQIVPLEVRLAPRERAQFRARLYDANGTFVRETSPAWAVAQVGGSIAADGTLALQGDAKGGVGTVTASADGLTGTAHVRVLPGLPLREDFEAWTGEAPPAQWVNAAGKFVVRDIDGTRALMRVEDNTTTRRARMFMGASTLGNYTIEVDARSTERRRQLGDVGVFGQRYGLILFGNTQRLELHPWQPATGMTVTAPFAWKADTWYRLKLRTENLADGTTRVQGKVWPTGEPEPTGWLVEKVDRIPHREGSPGLYADAPFGAYFDNIVVSANRN